MNGHYHLVITDEDGDDHYINETDFDTALRKTERKISRGSGRLSGFAFLCTFGCGLYHDLLPKEVEAVRNRFPGSRPVQLIGQHS